ncbi:MAG: hypothetical protein IH588_10155, partial [Anaerolineales bacterium]|nr:hypothetical protein [Anaerolineales bacterium]
MIATSAALLSVTFLLPIIVRWTKGQVAKDLFHPIHIACIFNFLTVIPFLLLLIIDLKFYPVGMRGNIADLPSAIFTYAIAHAAGFMCYLLGTATSIGKSIAKHLPAVKSRGSRKSQILGVTITAATAFAALALFLRQIGGYEALVFNTTTKPELGAGLGYILSFISPVLCLSPMFLTTKDTFRSKAATAAFYTY